MSALTPVIVLAVLILTLPVFAWTGRRRAAKPGDEHRGSFVLGDFIRNWFYWSIDPLVRLVVAVAPWPTALNIAGVVLGALAGIGFGSGAVQAGGWLLLASGVADALDGRIARSLGVASKRGAFLDSTLDRFAEVGAFVGLTFLYLDSWLGPMAALGLGGSLLVSYTRACGESAGVVCKIGVMQRAERILLLGWGAVLDPLASAYLGWEPNTLLAAVVVVTAVGTIGTALFRTIWIAARLPVAETDD